MRKMFIHQFDLFSIWTNWIDAYTMADKKLLNSYILEHDNSIINETVAFNSSLEAKIQNAE